MVNILLEGYDIGADWLRTELVRYLKPACRVLVVAYSFRDTRVRNVQDWERLYGTEHGWIAQGIAGGFASYGIPAENISFLNFFWILGNLPRRRSGRRTYCICPAACRIE